MHLSVITTSKHHLKFFLVNVVQKPFEAFAFQPFPKIVAFSDISIFCMLEMTFKVKCCKI